MGQWKGIKDWNKRRKKGLKNPTILWFWSLTVTFFLTVLPTILVSFISEEDRSGLGDLDIWIKIAVDNLYPMMITQSVVTILQNFSVITPPPEKDRSKWFAPYFGWTVALMIALIFYIIIYLLLILATPPKLNAILFAISGVLAVAGLISILQLDKEQEEGRKKHQENQKAQALQDERRSLSGAGAPVVLPNANDDLANAGDTSHTKGRTLV